MAVSSPEPTTQPKLTSRQRIAGVVKAPYFGWLVGLLAFAGYVAWLALPSRIPAVGLLALAAGGALASWAIDRPIGHLLRPEVTVTGGILLAAAALRFIGIVQSLPYVDNPDEPTMTLYAIKMLQTGDFNPHFFRWPSLPFYSQLIVSLPSYLAGVSAGQFSAPGGIVADNFYLAGRLVSATMGVATVWLTYLIGRDLYGRAVGWTGAFILAILPLHSEHSKYVTPDVMVAFFASLTLYFAAKIFLTGDKVWYIWAGIAAGLTAGAKYNVAIVLVTVWLAAFLRYTGPDGDKRFPWRNLLTSTLLTVVVFLITTPFAVLDLTGFLNEIAFQVRHYTIEGHGGAATDGDSWAAYAGYLFNEAFVYQATLALVGGVLTAVVRQRRADWLILSLPAIGYLFFSSAKVHFARNLMPLLPPLAILSACFIVLLAVKLSAINHQLLAKRNGGTRHYALGTLGLGTPALFMLILLMVFFGWAMLNSFLTTRYYTQPDSRKEAGAWMVANIEQGAKLRMENGAPLLPEGRYKEANERRPIGAHPLDWYQEQGYTYLVASSYEYKDLIASDPQAAANYRNVFEKARLVKEFSGDSPDHPGPTIKIFKIKF